MNLLQKTRVRMGIACGLIGLSFAVAWWSDAAMLRALWPAWVAVAAILALRNAIFGLGCGVVAGAIVITGGDLAAAPRVLLADHLFPSMQGPWKVGALVFTLLLGALAGLLEHSGGFATLMHRLMRGTRDAGRRVLMGSYMVGLLCFFDGLASSLLAGRIARPLADRAGVARERLAWVVDSTGSPVACVAFISTWIATQLSLIEQGLQGAMFQADPYAMFFQSVPANVYCLLTLLIVPLAIVTGYQPRAMRRCQPTPPAMDAVADDLPAPPPLRVVGLPLLALVVGIVAGFPLMSTEPMNVFSLAGWRASFSGSGGPYALVFGSVCGLLAAWWLLPRARKPGAAAAASQGAGALLPALFVLVLAWTLGSQFKALGAAEAIADLLGRGVSPAWMPLAVFTVGSLMSFATGTSWGTMGLLMPLVLPATLVAAANAEWQIGDTQALVAMVIGSVFGGATLGDHCSPFSDTTIVSALASGCSTMDHVKSQLPYVGIVAVCSIAAYSLMAFGAPPWSATAAAAAAMGGWVLWKGRLGNSHDRRA